MMSKIAVIIPAYKPDFLKQALTSLQCQTCKDFNVYIGDDASPYNLKKIVDDYYDKLNVYYCRFEKNVGGKDLVAQWERCIDLSESEPWIWLFSDDDEMDPTCIENFVKEQESCCHYDLYHFDVDIINGYGEKIGESRFPNIIDSYEFAYKRLRGRLFSYVVEYIFSRSHFEKCGRFQKFDLAWGSDDATWIKLGKEKGIKTIKGSRVKWRSSTVNISPNNSNIQIVKRKIHANIKYLNWLIKRNGDSFLKIIQLELVGITWFCANLLKYKNIISNKECVYYIRKLCSSLSCSIILPFAISYFCFREVKCKLLFWKIEK